MIKHLEKQDQPFGENSTRFSALEMFQILSMGSHTHTHKDITSSLSFLRVGYCNQKNGLGCLSKEKGILANKGDLLSP